MPVVTPTELASLRKHPHATKLYMVVDRHSAAHPECALTPYYYRIETAPVEEGGPKVIFYMDDSVPYASQHSDFGPVPIMGPPGVAFLDPITGLASLNFDGSGSYGVGGAIVSYDWTFAWGTPGTFFGSTPGMVTWNATGVHLVTLEVTDANGVTRTGYRLAYILDRDVVNDPDAWPYADWTLESLSGTYEEGLWKAGFTVRPYVYEAAPEFFFADGAQVVIFAETTYRGDGPPPGALGIGGFPGRENILFVGYLGGASTTWSAETSEIAFDAEGIVGLMKAIENYSFVYESPGTDTPNDWNEMYYPTPRRILWSLFTYFSNLIEVTDVHLLRTPQDEGDGGLGYVKYQDIPKGSLYAQAMALLESVRDGTIASDRQGSVYVEENIQCLPDADHAVVPTIMELTQDDWHGTVGLPEEVSRVSQVALYGVAYDPSTHAREELGGITPLASKAPEVQVVGGALEEYEGLILVDQDDANAIAGGLYEMLTGRFKKCSFPLLGAYTVFDIAPQEYFSITIEPSDTRRGLDWEDVNLIPRAVGIDFDPEAGALSVSIEGAEKETGDAVGIAIDLDTGAYTSGAYGYFATHEGDIVKFTLPALEEISTVQTPLWGMYPHEEVYHLLLNPSGTYLYVAGEFHVLRYELALWDTYVTGVDTPDTIVYNLGRGYAAGIDASGRYAYFAGSSGVDKVDLATFTITDSCAYTNPDPGANTIKCLLVDTSGDYVYLGLNAHYATNPPLVVKIATTPMVEISDTDLWEQHETLVDVWNVCVVPSPDGLYGYFGTSGYYHRLVRVRLADLSVQGFVDLPHNASSGALGVGDNFSTAYFASDGRYPKLSKIDLGDLTVKETLSALTGELALAYRCMENGSVPALVVDPAGACLYFGTGNLFAPVVARLLRVELTSFTSQDWVEPAAGLSLLRTGVVSP